MRVTNLPLVSKREIYDVLADIEDAIGNTLKICEGKFGFWVPGYVVFYFEDLTLFRVRPRPQSSRQASNPND